MTQEFSISVSKGPGGGMSVMVTQNSYGPVTLLVPELDRLIAELCRARDQARAMNRPVHKFTDLT